MARTDHSESISIARIGAKIYVVSASSRPTFEIARPNLKAEYDILRLPLFGVIPAICSPVAREAVTL
jgi:hypothetical protein